MLQCREEILNLTKQLVSMNSIVNTKGEKEIADSLFELISSEPYFKENPSNVVKQRTVDDEVERYNILAFVKGTKSESNKTIILSGHIDTVDITDFNHLMDVACSPDKLMNVLQTEELPPSVKAHLDSGDWLFGRGTADMKSGVASNLYLLKHYAQHPELLSGNLVFLAECDEEDGSHGILSAIKQLNNWREEHKFEYAAAINADFVSPQYEGDDNRYIYKGTIGKLLPTFFVTGAETHVGSCFEGLDPNFIISELTKQISYNPNLCDQAFGETTAPPVCLKQMDLKPSYTVQTALSAFVYFNFFTYSWSPKEVLSLLKVEATKAFANALTIFEERFKQYCSIGNQPYQPLSWQPKIFTYEELEQILVQEHGHSFTFHINEFKSTMLLQTDLDTRMFAVRVVEEAWKWMRDQSPAIVLFYSSLYYPKVELSGKTSYERELSEALEHAVEEIQPHYTYPIRIKHFFHISCEHQFRKVRCLQ